MDGTVFRLLQEVHELKFVNTPGKLRYENGLGCFSDNEQLFLKQLPRAAKDEVTPWPSLRSGGLRRCLSRSVNNSFLVRLAYYCVE